MLIHWINEAQRKWWVLAAMTASISMIFIDITVLPVVLPTLQRELAISDLGLQWIINAYTLTLAVFVLAGGRLGDMLGLKKAFCCGLIIFAGASALCGLSASAWWMILSRSLQGIGGACMLPATQGIIIANFPPHQRGKAMGLFVSIGSIFLALGPLIGGSLTSYFSWHYVFWINLPIAFIGLCLALLCVPAMPGKKEEFDLRGFLILSCGIFSLIFAMMQSQHWGWLSMPTLALLCLGSLCLYLLFRRRSKPHATLIDFELLKKKSFFSSSSCIFFIQLVIMVTVFWSIYFQNILGFSASKAGLYSFYANIPLLVAAPIGGFLVDRYGPRLPVMLGFGLVFFSLSWLVIFCRHESLFLLLPTLACFGSGSTLIFTPSFVAMMNEVPAEKRGIASGINSSLRQFSSSFGLALFGTLYSVIYFGRLGYSLKINPSTTTLVPQQFEGLLSQAPQAIKTISLLQPSDAQYIINSAKQAFLQAFSVINLIGASVALTGILIAWRLLKNQRIPKES